jgi:hypothetical protein
VAPVDARDMSIVTFTPVRVEPEILERHLDHLELVSTEHRVEHWFYDDNDDPQSSQLLVEWARRHETMLVLPETNLIDTDYRRDGATHQWSDVAVSRIAQIKNYAIGRFLETSKASHVFFVDADVLVAPGTIDHLIGVEAPIISAVYWTQFTPGDPYMPNVWDRDKYGFDSIESILRLAQPGHHAVGGLGACTLIERHVLESGVDFSPIPNLRIWGEDRHFCIRAMCAGFPLAADSCVTPFHVYRTDLLEDADTWTAADHSPDWFRTHWVNSVWETSLRSLAS